MNRSCQVGLLALGLTGLLGLIAAWPQPVQWPEIEQHWRVQIVAHRGGLIERPDSTLAAFDHAAAVGAAWLELDVHLSADGVPVVIHDLTVDRTTDGTGRVADLSWDELQRLNAAYRWPDDLAAPERRFGPENDALAWRDQGLRILTLDEVLRRYPDHRLMIEIKPAGEQVVQAVLAVIARHGRERSVLLASFHEDTLASARKLAPGLATAASARETRRFVILASIGLARFWPRQADALAIPPTLGERELITPRLLRAARAIGLPVYVWTINDPEEWDRLIDLGVDGILTDRPQALQAHLKARRRPPNDQLHR